MDRLLQISGGRLVFECDDASGAVHTFDVDGGDENPAVQQADLDASTTSIQRAVEVVVGWATVARLFLGAVPSPCQVRGMLAGSTGVRKELGEFL